MEDVQRNRKRAFDVRHRHITFSGSRIEAGGTPLEMRIYVGRSSDAGPYASSGYNSVISALVG
jgi:hypothetical protein